MAQVLPQTTYEQRSPHYADIESLISVGFISHQVRVNGVNLALRTLSSGDLFLLQTRVGGSLERDWRLWLTASSVWMIQGVCLLEDPSSVHRTRQALSRVPPAALDALNGAVLGLFQRQYQAYEGAEAFAYETPSRFLWRAQRGSLGGRTGIPGAERLGSNNVQTLWAVINALEDQREDQDALWESAKLVASAQSPKGIKKLDQHDVQKKERETGRRQRVMDTYFYYRKGLMALKGGVVPLGQAHVDGSTKTVEDLEDEMRRWVVGEHDWHDVIVEKYKAHATGQVEQEKKERQERLAAVHREAARQEIDYSKPRPLVGYTAEQMSEMVRSRGQGPGAKRVVLNEKDRQYLYDKYLAEEPSSGHLQAADGQLVDDGSLDAKVARRAVQFHSREEG